MHRLFVLTAPLFAIAAIPASAAPGDMTIAAFLPKVEALKKKGMMAMFSSDYKTVKAEAEGAASQYRARIESDRKTGRTPHSCPPPKGKASMDSDALLAHLKSYSARQRQSTTIKVAFADLMKKRYPCS